MIGGVCSSLNAVDVIEGFLEMVGEGRRVDVARSTPLARNVNAITVGRNSVGRGVAILSPLGLAQLPSRQIINRALSKRGNGCNLKSHKSHDIFSVSKACMGSD